MGDAEKKGSAGPAGPALAAVTVAAVIITSVVLGVAHRRLGQGTVTIGDGPTVAVEVASTPETRERGLSGREPLGPLEGMLFLFPSADRYAFWMKDMHFPIDILWIDGDELVDITTDAAVPSPGEEIPRYFPKFPADKALEVAAGFARSHGLKAGMTVRTNIDKK